MLGPAEVMDWLAGRIQRHSVLRFGVWSLHVHLYGKKKAAKKQLVNIRGIRMNDWMIDSFVASAVGPASAEAEALLVAVMRHREPEREQPGRLGLVLPPTMLLPLPLCIFFFFTIASAYIPPYLRHIQRLQRLRLLLLPLHRPSSSPSHGSSIGPARARDPTVCRSRRIINTFEARQLDSLILLQPLPLFRQQNSFSTYSRRQVKTPKCPTSATACPTNTPAPPSAARDSARCTCRCSRPMRR
ncbi:hypothetical protein ACQKWADRAFT_305370 [Trichoderma austrokoningii]